VKTSKQYTKKEILSTGEEDYRLCVQNYTIRDLTKEYDSLNAFEGMIGYLTKCYFPDGLIWGLPLREFPQALRWCHYRTATPRRRNDFPTWAWCGWQGKAIYSAPLDLTKEYQDSPHIMTDLTVEFVRHDNQILTVRGYQVRLDIRKEPFSEAFVPDTNSSLGPVVEGDLPPHKNNLTSGRYVFLVVERLKYGEAHPLKEKVYMLLLDWDGFFWLRNTQVLLILEPGLKFEIAKPHFVTMRLK